MLCRALVPGAQVCPRLSSLTVAAYNLAARTPDPDTTLAVNDIVQIVRARASAGRSLRRLVVMSAAASLAGLSSSLQPCREYVGELEIRESAEAYPSCVSDLEEWEESVLDDADRYWSHVEGSDDSEGEE